MDPRTPPHVRSRRSRHRRPPLAPGQPGVAPVCLPRPEAAGKFFLPLRLCSRRIDFRSCSPPLEMLRPVRANERKPATYLGKWDQTEAIRPTCRGPPKVTGGERQSGGLRNRSCSPTSLKEGARLSPGVYPRRVWDSGGSWAAAAGNAWYLQPQVQFLSRCKNALCLCWGTYFPSVSLHPWCNKFPLVGQQQTLDSPFRAGAMDIEQIKSTGLLPQERVNSY